jgi:hypothetical protein
MQTRPDPLPARVDREMTQQPIYDRRWESGSVLIRILATRIGHGHVTVSGEYVGHKGHLSPRILARSHPEQEVSRGTFRVVCNLCDDLYRAKALPEMAPIGKVDAFSFFPRTLSAHES